MSIPNNTPMRSFLTALALIATAAIPASATPTQREIVNPFEPMVVIPELQFLCASRISTIEHCAELEYITDWKNMITDEELFGMEACLIEHN